MKELLDYLLTRKKYWLVPVILALLIIGALIILAESSALASFIYTLF